MLELKWEEEVKKRKAEIDSKAVEEMLKLKWEEEGKKRKAEA